MDVMPVKQHNHHCIVCGAGYHYCNDCNKIASFTPWRMIACSIECYQAHLAYIEYRDITHDAKKFAEMIDFCGIDVEKIHEVMKEAYARGVAEKSANENVKAEAETEEMAHIEAVDESELFGDVSPKITKARRK